MVRSTVDYYTFNVKPRKKSPNIPRSAVNLGNGRSILPYLYGYIDYQRGRELSKKNASSASMRSVTLKFTVASY